VWLLLLAPRINAAGRNRLCQTALELLLTDDEQLAQTWRKRLNRLTRKKIVGRPHMDEARQAHYADPKRRYSKILVVDGAGWHSGVSVLWHPD
jgi:single-stranded DNA-specific DHH superfamily exonuclease